MRRHKLQSLTHLLVAVLGLTFGLGGSHTAAAATVSLFIDPAAGPPARHAFGKLKSVLREKKLDFEEVRDIEFARGRHLMVSGLGRRCGAPATLVSALELPLPEEPESLLIRHAQWKGKNLLLVCGADDRGLMYALFDVAERVGWGTDPADPFAEVRDISERPAVPERALSIYTMHRAYFESRFFDERYWARYLDMLAANRFNSFVLIFGYEADGYFAPAFPYFFDVEGFPGVRVVGLTEDQQQRNLRALNRLIEMAHERGLNLTLGLWDHIFRGGVQGSDNLVGKPTPGLVRGLNEKNLMAYSEVGLRKFLRLVPEVDAIQFRMHGESGLVRGEMREFWRRIYQVMKTEGTQVRFDARAKGYPDDLIDLAVELGLNFRLCTKYWAEQMGMPFHPTHINRQNQFDRRHGYADMLRYPKKYDMHWRLWNGGTTRILLWGDPDFVRRFVQSTMLYDGDGFEVNEPLATKMAGQPHDLPPFELLRPQYRYYDFEFERYWHFFQLFGRLGYNPETPAEVWKKEFEKRFGKEAAPFVERALHRASRILPRIQAYNFPSHRFPLTRGWVEKQRREDLPVYAAAEPSDTQQFLSIEAEVLNLLRGEQSAKIRPQGSSEWFARMASEVLEQVKEAEEHAGAQRSKEFVSTIVDLRILANLALYHSRRIHAGLAWGLFQHSRDLNALDDAIAGERRAIEAWRQIVEAAGDVYHEDLMMGLRRADLSGHWKVELAKLQAGLEQLKQQRKSFQPEFHRVVGRFDFGDGQGKAGYQRLKRRSTFTTSLPSGHYELRFTIRHDSGDSVPYGPMWIEANGLDRTDTFTVQPGGTVEKKLETTVTDGQFHVAFHAASMGRWHISEMTIAQIGPVIAHVPARRVGDGEDLVIRATVSGADQVRIVYGNESPGYRDVEMTSTGPWLYRAVIPANVLTEDIRYFIEARDAAGRRTTWPAQGASHAVNVTVTRDTEPPLLWHTPVTHASAGKPLSITARVSDLSGIMWVRLRYRSVNQHQDFRTLPMLPTGENQQYRVEVPGGHIRPEWDFMYLIEVMDGEGNGKIYPDLEKETPYVIVRLDRSSN